MFTPAELKAIYQRILVTPPFNNVMVRFTAEINKLVEERMAEYTGGGYAGGIPDYYNDDGWVE
jgi:hypothetical protein